MDQNGSRAWDQNSISGCRTEKAGVPRRWDDKHAKGYAKDAASPKAELGVCYEKA